MKLNISIRRIAQNLCCVLSIIFIFSSCTQSQDDLPVLNPNRVIEFSGYKWLVRSSDEGKQGPGPNYFSNSKENVWIDEDGRLHLKIVEKEGRWYCSEVTLRRSYGFNKYVFYVASRVGQLNENVVGGLFTYKNDEEEIDIEFSKWSDPQNDDSQFAVQPSFKPGNKSRYNLDLKNSLSTHFINWQANKIEFASFNGFTLDPKNEDIISTWTYTGNSIPPDSDEKLKINLWLFKGKAPTNNQEAEMIIDHVEIH